MSRPFLIGILAIMLGLLGLMSFYVKADPKAEKEKQEKAMMESQKKSAEQEKAQAQEKMQADAKVKMRDIARQVNKQKVDDSKAPKGSPSNIAKQIPQVKHATENPNDDMTWDWAQRREPGEAGMQKVIKAAEEAKKHVPPPVPQVQGSSSKPIMPVPPP